jgi:plastocyanin
MNSRNWLGAALVIALGIAVLIGLHSPQPVLGGMIQLKITAKEFVFAPKTLTAAAGPVQFLVTNTGVVEHSFVSDVLKVKSGPIKPGQTMAITATTKPGTYKFYCDIPGHKELGMVVTITAK